MSRPPALTQSGPDREDKKLTKIARRDVVQLGAGAVVGVTLCGACAERFNFRPGERIALAPRLDCAHLFDAQSGVNLML